MAAAGVEGGLGHEVRVVGDPGRLERGAVAFTPLLGGGVGERRVRDAGDPPPAQADQVLDRPAGAADVVDVNARDVEPGMEPWSTIGKPSRARRPALVVDARPGDDEAVDVLGPE